MLRLTLAAALIALPSIAAAGGFAEAVVGGAVPLGDSEWTDTVDASVKLGVRAGSLGERGAGLELTLDFTPVSFVGQTTFGNLDTTAQRFRALLGGRLQRHLGGPGRFFARVGAGVDVGHVATQGNVLGFDVDESQTDVGLALELGAGAGVDLGSVFVAGQVAFPLAFHFDDNDPDDTHDYDFEYTAVDLDLLFSVGSTF
jgi:hypothetical protein